MKPGYKKKAITSKKKLAKQQRREAKHAESLSKKAEVELDVAEAAAAMDIDEEAVAKPLSRREKKKREVLAVKKQRLKTDLLKKTTIKGRKKAARGIEGATNLAVSTVGSRHLQQAQKQQQLAASLKAVGVDVEMKLA